MFVIKSVAFYSFIHFISMWHMGHIS